jgi:methylated-DNA-protein-cysteine methyltransferase-like protein
MKTRKTDDNFFDRVFAVVKKIPRGRVTNYGAIAEYIGTGLSSRMVGWAMHSSQVSKSPVPAHRVVNRNGLLTGKHHFASPVLMQELLEAEGVNVVDDKVQDFKKIFWDPATELKPFQGNKTTGIPGHPLKKLKRGKLNR